MRKDLESWAICSFSLSKIRKFSAAFINFSFLLKRKHICFIERIASLKKGFYNPKLYECDINDENEADKRDDEYSNLLKADTIFQEFMYWDTDIETLGSFTID